MVGTNQVRTNYLNEALAIGPLCLNDVVSLMLISVVETTIFTRRATALLSREEYDALIDFLAANPYVGDEIVGTGGVRKLRFAAQGKGKSGGVRVVYYVLDEAMPLYALLIYGKGEQADLTAEQRKSVKAIAASLKDAHRKRRNNEQAR